MTQKDKVLKFLQARGSITSWQAIQEFRITRLSSIIFDLRKEGWEIDSENMKSKNSNANNFAKYTLIADSQNELFNPKEVKNEQGYD